MAFQLFWQPGTWFLLLLCLLVTFTCLIKVLLLVLLLPYMVRRCMYSGADWSCAEISSWTTSCSTRKDISRSPTSACVKKVLSVIGQHGRFVAHQTTLLQRSARVLLSHFLQYLCDLLLKLHLWQSDNNTIMVGAYYYWPPPIWGRHLFCKCCFFLESIPSTFLNGSLRNFNTRRVSVGNRTIRRDFFGIFVDPKTTYFRWLRNSVAVWGKIYPAWKLEHDIDNRETVLETTKGSIVWTLVH